MKLKKFFKFELYSGLILSTTTILMFIFARDSKEIAPLYTFLLFMFVGFGTNVGRALKKLNSEEKLVIQDATIFSGLILVLIFVFWFLNMKTSFEGMDHALFSLIGLIYFSISMLLNSLFGFYYMKKYATKLIEISSDDTTVEQLEPELPFLMINKTLFLTIAIGGGGILIISSYFLKWHSSPFEHLVIPACLIGYISIVAFINIIFNERRFLDEREKNILYKVSSIAAFLTFISMLIIYALNNNYLLGVQIKEAWGILVIPIFMMFWGISGVIILIKQDGWQLLKEDE